MLSKIYYLLYLYVIISDSKFSLILHIGFYYYIENNLTKYLYIIT